MVLWMTGHLPLKMKNIEESNNYGGGVVIFTNYKYVNNGCLRS